MHFNQANIDFNTPVWLFPLRFVIEQRGTINSIRRVTVATADQRTVFV